jgi:hypothetical protein
MIMNKLAIAMLTLISPLLAVAGDGEYCVIPKLIAGVPTTVQLEHIDKPFCGMALVDRRYVRLDDVTKARDEGEVECSSRQSCTKTNRYYQDDQRATAPYIIIFEGPKQKKDA